MVFKGRFFSSKKSDSSSSPDGSPSTARSDKKKAKSNDAAASTPRHTLVKDAVDKHHLQQQQKKKGSDGKDSKGKEAAHAPSPKPSPPPAASFRAPAKLRKGPAAKDGAGPAAASLSPILASSLGLNRIKTRSGPLPQEGLRVEHGMSGPGSSNLSRGTNGTASSSALSTSMARGKSGGVGSSGEKKDGSAHDKVPESSTSSWVNRGGSGGGGAKQWSAASADTPFGYKLNEKRIRMLVATSVPRKKFPGDVKSFSHELSSKGVRPFPFWKPRSTYNLKVKFEKAKEEVNSDLAIFAGDLVSIMEKNLEHHPEWKEVLEDLLILARSCCVMTAGEFWLQCEGIVQDLDDRRQELSSGMLKTLHTHMLFILTRCTRLLQFHKERGFAEDEIAMDPGSKVMHLAEVSSVSMKDRKPTKAERNSVEAFVSRKSRSQEQNNLKWKRSQEIKPVDYFSQLDIGKYDSPSTRERMASWKPLPSPAPKDQKKSSPLIDESLNEKVDSVHLQKSSEEDLISSNLVEQTSPVDASVHPTVSSKHQHKYSWGFWADQQSISEEGSIMCRICEEYVPTSFVEEHSKVCAVVDRCDQKGLSVDERLLQIAETLEKMIDSYTQKDLPNVTGSPDVAKISNSSVTEESDIPSPKLCDLPQRGLGDMLDCLHEAENPLLLDDLKYLPSMTCKTRFGPKSDQGVATSSIGSMTPRSPLMTPRASHIDMLLAGKSTVSESDDLPQVNIV
ncbi:hypothetical protein BHE74_00023220 [Ensete ventricosum]|nr:hypothetical protein BHE74_00023220 [Ensete ventricosum]